MEKTNEIYYLNKYKYLEPEASTGSKKDKKDKKDGKGEEAMSKEEKMRLKELKKKTNARIMSTKN